MSISIPSTFWLILYFNTFFDSTFQLIAGCGLEPSQCEFFLYKSTQNLKMYIYFEIGHCQKHPFCCNTIKSSVKTSNVMNINFSYLIIHKNASNKKTNQLTDVRITLTNGNVGQVHEASAHESRLIGESLPPNTNNWPTHLKM